MSEHDLQSTEESLQLFSDNPETLSTTNASDAKVLVSTREASAWATSHLGKTVSPANIDYLLKYGQIPRFSTRKGEALVDLNDVKSYYRRRNELRKQRFRQQIGDDLNWDLSFDQYKEKQTTKHVHRLHPYKGKFIPQLVEYFLDSHTDEYKRDVFFKPGDLILDPFCGSGTTLVQANELGINCIGIDVSKFNALISNLKVNKVDIVELILNAKEITNQLEQSEQSLRARECEIELKRRLKAFNQKFFPSQIIRQKFRSREVDEHEYGEKLKRKFEGVWNKTLKEFGLVYEFQGTNSYVSKWLNLLIKDEIQLIQDAIKKITNPHMRDLVQLILSRTVRSSRSTSHFELTTLSEPIRSPYYCKKHTKICVPKLSLYGLWTRYLKDTTQRLNEFDQIRTNTQQVCIAADSKDIDLEANIEGSLQSMLKNQKASGVFSSPPYVGLIDYHEQHAYAYELFNFKRNDRHEIGPLSNGQSRSAQDDYVAGIASVLNNMRKYMKNDFHVLLVANDKFDLYPKISRKARMRINQRFERPVLNRSEGSQNAFSETIFDLINDE